LSGKVQVFLQTRKWTKEQLKQEKLNKSLLTQDNQKHNAWHVAAQRDNADVLDKL
jgi:hypothetical protein